MTTVHVTNYELAAVKLS